MSQQESWQEILVVAVAPVVNKNLRGINSGKKKKRLTVERVLNEACRSGLLTDMISNAPANRPNNDKLFHWKVFAADAFFCVELYQTPIKSDYFQSLNPYLFMSSVNYS